MQLLSHQLLRKNWSFNDTSLQFYLRMREMGVYEAETFVSKNNLLKYPAPSRKQNK